MSRQQSCPPGDHAGLPGRGQGEEEQTPPAAQNLHPSQKLDYWQLALFYTETQQKLIPQSFLYIQRVSDLS